MNFIFRYCLTRNNLFSQNNKPVEYEFIPRDTFKLPTQFNKIHWFPRHMSIQLKRMEGKLRTIDLIVEVCYIFLLFLTLFRCMTHE